MGKYVMIALLLTTTVALAMDEGIFIPKPVPLPLPNPITEEEAARVQPTEGQKFRALKEAYEIRNGIRTPITPDTKYNVLDMTPVAKTEDKNEIDQEADIDRLQRKWIRLRGDKFAKTDTCQRHHMRKITTSDGQSWRCRK